MSEKTGAEVHPRPHRVAVGGLLIECNHLGGVPADLAAFEENEFRRGDEVLEHTGVIGGMVDVLRQRGVSIRPLIMASCCSRGPVTAACYDSLKREMVDRLRQAMPVDGVVLALHGAAAAENARDLDGDLIEAVRAVVGPDVPVVVTLDLHADVTEPMVRGADALVAWETYPHVDTFETGVRGARLLLDILDGKCRPTMAVAKVPVLVGAIHGGTSGESPFADIMRLAKSHEGRDDVVSTSVLLVHPYIDVPGMGGGGVVITNNNMERAETLAREIAEMYWQRRFDFEPKVYSPAEAIRLGMAIDGGPVLLVETADCCGGGAAGDSVASLRALLEADRNLPALVPVVDPEAAAACHRAGEGAEVTLDLGHKIDPKWGSPLRVTGKIVKLTDGRFQYGRGGVWCGQEGNMGPTAVLRVGSVKILIASRATYDWADEQFRSVGMDPTRAKFLVAKNPMNYHMAYGAISRAAFILDTPGPTPATVRHVPYRHMQRPYFPLDPEIPHLAPTVFRGR